MFVDIMWRPLQNVQKFGGRLSLVSMDAG